MLAWKPEPERQRNVQREGIRVELNRLEEKWIPWDQDVCVLIHEGWWDRKRVTTIKLLSHAVTFAQMLCETTPQSACIPQHPARCWRWRRRASLLALAAYSAESTRVVWCRKREKLKQSMKVCLSLCMPNCAHAECVSLFVFCDRGWFLFD